MHSSPSTGQKERELSSHESPQSAKTCLRKGMYSDGRHRTEPYIFAQCRRGAGDTIAYAGKLPLEHSYHHPQDTIFLTLQAACFLNQQWLRPVTLLVAGSVLRGEQKRSPSFLGYADAISVTFLWVGEAGGHANG